MHVVVQKTYDIVRRLVLGSVDRPKGAVADLFQYIVFIVGGFAGNR